MMNEILSFCRCLRRIHLRHSDHSDQYKIDTVHHRENPLLSHSLTFEVAAEFFDLEKCHCLEIDYHLLGGDST